MRDALPRILGAAVAAALLVSCRQEPAARDDAATAPPAADGAATATRADLAYFAPLPARMVADGGAPSETQVALGRQLYHETLLSGNHDVSCNSCHPLNAYGADGRALSVGDRGQPDKVRDRLRPVGPAGGLPAGAAVAQQLGLGHDRDPDRGHQERLGADRAAHRGRARGRI